MNQNRRIAINVLATYGRNLFGLVCGLFSARWVLNALGQEDFGLYGLVGGLAVFITFFNGLMSGATSRFYAFAVGAAQTTVNDGIEECRAWFNTALMIHCFQRYWFASDIQSDGKLLQDALLFHRKRSILAYGFFVQ